MKAFVWKSLGIAGMAIGAGSVASAQSTEYSSSAPRVIVVTAGQGGAISLPAVVMTAQPYTLTGESSQFDRARRAWQQQAGPRLRVGQSEITLPASR